MKNPVSITYYSDILCIWAYCAQVRVDEIRVRFADEVEIDFRFISVFGNTQLKIGDGWKDRGGFEGYDDHVREVAERFLHVDVHPQLWRKTRPASSASPHLFLKAVHLAHGASLEKTTWALRRAFFKEALDIADAKVQWRIAGELDLPLKDIETTLKNGMAMAALCEDYQMQREHSIEGSPTFLLNDGRQRLFGNVGYRVIEANIQELLRATDSSQASWC
ncbi:MAG: DsbA family protein [Proteobacteria bacterium]|nr:DsbA family protein [Pseudomonadota bacterium]